MLKKRLVLLGLLISSTTLALDCNNAPTGSFNNAWWMQFKAWCRGCGGTICEIYSDCQGTCTPGPNWGGRNSGGNSGGGSAYSAPTSSDPSTAMMQGLMQGMMQGLQESANRPAPAPVYKSPEQIEAERQAAIAAAAELERKRAAKAARLDNDALGMVALLRDPHTQDVGAKGKPIIDCAATKSKRDKLAAGLPQQKEALQKTRDQLESAKGAKEEADAETRKTLNEALISEAKNLSKETLKTADALKKALEKAKLANHLSVEKAAEIKTALEEVTEGALTIGKVKKSAKAGHEYGKQLQEPAQSFSQKIAAANKLFVESGIAEEVGEELSKAVGGPLGALSFRAVKLSIDVGYSAGKGMISYSEVQKAEENIKIMERSLSEYQSKVAEWDQDLCNNCKSEGFCQ